ncbi:MAG TPA: tRNA (5-methylaminomethyl-2-thiouridine)(34)-methyltransferase MnmD [Caulobacteraceae bacterium]|nr:tRNA (5-methylaminomethyl-2-thiouridine)(34)-methyltransferase MnmD [Caulobacteraceae bacterium]
MDAPAVSPVSFDADGVPHSRRYGDVYFSREGGLAESRTVFLAGCGLPGRWSGRRRFTVGELGFGTGLNILALLALWRERRPSGAQLSIFSVEAEPLTADEARRALAAWPELAPAADLLLARWPGRRRGFHRIDLPELGATLDLAVMDAAAALSAWRGRADAWFLDGFAPSVNPAMWTDDLMALVAQRSASGAVAATYTVAGQARRALSAAGFTLQRRPGFGGKRERLEATLPGEAPIDAPAPPRVAIVGAGIAGAALARAFQLQGLEARVFETAQPGSGPSGNPAALVTPRLDAGLGEAAQLHAQAFAGAVALYEAVSGAVVGRGVLQLEAAPRDAARFARIAAADLYEPGALGLWSAAEVSAALGEAAPAALHLAAALTIDPGAILAAWLPPVETGRVTALAPGDGAWRLLSADGRTLAEADVVCLASGAALAELWPGAPIQPVRGQLSYARGVASPAAAWGHYVAPTRDGIVFGATHARDDASAEWRADDDRRNLAVLAERLPALASRLGAARIDGRASVRATTPDRLPMAGQVARGLYVLGGLGSRGFTLAPLLAEQVAALALGAPSPLPASLARIVGPDRFADRAARRLAGARAAV